MVMRLRPAPTIFQVCRTKVAVKPEAKVLKPLLTKGMPFLIQPSIVSYIAQASLETHPTKVLHPKFQGAPVEVADGGVWRWTPMKNSGKRIRYVCIHGKRKETCAQCGGSAICVHKRHRRFCRQCKGASLCCHGVQKSRCTSCKRDANDDTKE